MNKRNKTYFFSYLYRFSITHLAIYMLFNLLIAYIFNHFGIFQIDTTYTFRQFSLYGLEIIVQLVRGLIMALILYPFYETIIRNRFGWLIIFGIIWGLSYIGAINTIPGSIEGMIYTTTPIEVHLYFIVKSMAEVLTFAMVFCAWERLEYIKYSNDPSEKFVQEYDKNFLKYIARFDIVYLVAYLLMGIIFMNLQDYSNAFETMEAFENFRPLDSAIVRSAPLIQIFRGSILAIIIYPLYEKIMEEQQGWYLLFFVMWGFTFLVVEGQISALFKNFIDYGVSEEFFVGIPEVFIQMLFFSIVFYFWEKRNYKKRML